MKLTFIISDHGFGHMTRCLNIIELLLKDVEEIKIISSVPEFLIEERIGKNEKIKYIKFKTDIGVIQKSSIEIDIDETRKHLKDYWDNFENKIKELKEICKGTDKIIFDISPLGPYLGKEMSIKSIGISNFSWDWIYEEYENFEEYIKKFESCYLQTDIFIKLPYCPDLKGFKNSKQFSVGFFGEKSKLSKKEILKRLEWDENLTYIFYTFGGHSFNNLYEHIKEWKIISGFNIVIIDNNFQDNIKNLKVLNSKLLNNLNLKYIDIFHLSDIVVGKTGFGFVSESIINSKKVLYTKRGKFREESYLIHALKENTDSLEIDIQDILNPSSDLFQIIQNFPKNDLKNIVLDGDIDIKKIIIGE